jgi:diguanylate cyclase (GGDEF)-like protein/PAS domain S-box-containing protein
MSVLGCFGGSYDFRLVALAGFICVVACFATADLLSRAQMNASGRRYPWLTFAAIVFGSGVWALHFIAMMAYMPGLRISYDLIRTGTSILVAILGSGLSFAVWTRFGRGKAAVFLGAACLAAAIGGMHYDGVSAMRASAMIRLDLARVALSILFAFALAILFLVRAADLRSVPRRIETSGYLGIAVLGLHFIGMSALTLIPGLDSTIGAIITSNALAVAVGSVSVAIVLCGMVGAMTDRQLADRADLEARRLKQLADASFEGIVIHCDGVIHDCNRAFARMVGRPIDELIGRPALDFVAKKDLARIRERMDDHRSGGRIELDFDVPDGPLRPVEVLSRPIDFGGRTGFVSAVRDLTEQKRAEQKIRHLANHDALTDLCNRRALADRLTQMIALAERSGHQLAVLYLDLDRFKPVNDLLGHEAGDALLVEVATRLKGLVRTSDIVARVGGDEFVVVQASGAEPDLAEASAERIIAALSAPFLIGGEEAVIGTSVGIARFPADGRTAEELVRNADKAMYHAKQTERGTCCTFKVGIDYRLHEMRVLERELRHAIERHEIEVHYQPVFGGETSRIAGVEALVRWRHPTRGMVSPAEFIPVAEESGFIRELGGWVLETACRDAKSWPDHLRVAVNVSPAQFARDDFAQTVFRVLGRTGLAPDRLELEVTESLLIGDTSKVLPTLIALRRHGVHLSLDDFGTGYSSLNYLHQFPFEKIKIDRSFISRLGEADDAKKIIGAIIALARGLNMTVTAEGVELQSQLEILRQLDCDLVQGYLLGRPTRKREISAFFKAVIRPPVAEVFATAA